MLLGHSSQPLSKSIVTVPQNGYTSSISPALLKSIAKFNTLYHITVIGRFIRSADFLGTFGCCLFVSKTNNKMSEQILFMHQ